MHGQGNDFVVLGFKETPEMDFPAIARKMCRRNFGAGADGLIAVLPSSIADFKMRVFNPDGSEPEMCGNGIRCAAKYFIERMMVKSAPAPEPEGEISVDVETLAGVLKTIARCKDGSAEEMSVDMGAPILAPARIPVQHDADIAIRIPLEAAGRKIKATCVSMGNPHAVIFVDKELSDDEFLATGPAVEIHAAFPNRTNVEFVRVINRNELRMRVWERGVGETLACGTGACAATVAACLNEYCDRDVTVHLKGGDLRVSWTASDNIIMTGTAVVVYEGDYLDLY